MDITIKRDNGKECLFEARYWTEATGAATARLVKEAA
jgi:hypothetical protein